MVLKNRLSVLSYRKCVSLSFVAGYLTMCIYWLITGLRYGALQCLDIMFVSFGVYIVISFVLHYIFSYKRNAELRRLKNHLWTYGYDDAYFNLLENFVSENISLSDHGKLILSSAYAEGKRFEKCMDMISTVSFDNLPLNQQNEYFNVLLLNAINNGKISLANNIYSKAHFYFSRAMITKNNENIIHTMGMLSYVNGNYSQAIKLFKMARKGKGKSLKCECDLWLGFALLKIGKLSDAKKRVYKAAEETCTKQQIILLKKLMQETESAFKIDKRKKQLNK